MSEVDGYFASVQWQKGAQEPLSLLDEPAELLLSCVLSIGIVLQAYR